MEQSKLKYVIKNLFDQLQYLVRELSEQEISTKLEIISGSTIGMHIRHIIEFFDCFLIGVEQGRICYDDRKRELSLEKDKQYILNSIEEVIQKLNTIENKNIHLSVNYFMEGVTETIPTNVNRELVCNIEHAVHHMAIISIAMKHSFQYIDIPEFFGVAQSTIAHLKHSRNHEF